MDEAVRWRCRNGHTLGLVVSRGGVRVLLLFREAADNERPYGDKERREPNYEVDVMAVLEGDAAEVRCSICGAIRMWVADGRWLRKKLKGYRKEAVDG